MANIYNSQLDAFDLYHQVHDSYYSRPSTSILGGPALPALGHALAGSIGATISNISTYPLALIVTRLQLQKHLRRGTSSSDPDDYDSIQDAAIKIYSQEGGLKALYTGWESDTSKTIADSFLFFLAYSFLRQSRIRSGQNQSSRLPVFDELGVGFLAGAFSKFLTTPIANVVTRKQAFSMMAKRSANFRGNDSIRSIALKIRSEKGLQGFWSGYSASLVLTLNPSLTFFFFETLKRALIPRNQRSHPSPQATFLLAAMSKAMASMITYPFSLAKSRAQTSSNDDSHEDVKDSRASTSHRSGNVFKVVSHIARREGISGLYDGLGGEVLKGFFSHGITMIAKDMIHKTILRLYYAILRLLKKYPTSGIIGTEAKEKANQLSSNVTDQAVALSQTAKKRLQSNNLMIQVDEESK